MADILIRGMDIPKDGRKHTVLLQFLEDGKCRGIVEYSKSYDDRSVKVFEVVSLPEWHGRLIDADAVVKTICNSCDGACDVVQCDCLNCKADCRCDIVKEISDAPTIIEADLEWKMKNCCCFSNTDQAEGGTDDG